LALVLGLNMANADAFCVWCLADKKHHNDHRLACGEPRRLEDVKEYFDNDGVPPKGQKARPIIDCIDFDHVVIDTLHVLLRITDAMLKGITADFARFKPKDRNRAQANFIAACKKVGVKFEFWNETPKKTVFTSLQGPDKLSLFDKADISMVFHDGIALQEEEERTENLKSRAAQHQSLWRQFMVVYELLRTNNPTATDIDDFRTSTAKFIDYFCKSNTSNTGTGAIFSGPLNTPETITPYMHALVHHCPDMMRTAAKYGSMQTFCCQTLEAKNGRHTAFFHRYCDQID
jgi:hypothetical protein